MTAACRHIKVMKPAMKLKEMPLFALLQLLALPNAGREYSLFKPMPRNRE